MTDESVVDVLLGVAGLEADLTARATLVAVYDSTRKQVDALYRAVTVPIDTKESP